MRRARVLGCGVPETRLCNAGAALHFRISSVHGAVIVCRRCSPPRTHLQLQGHPALTAAAAMAWIAVTFTCINVGTPWHQEAGSIRVAAAPSTFHPVSLYTTMWTTWFCEDLGDDLPLQSSVPRESCIMWLNYNRPDAVSFLFRGMSAAAGFSVLALALGLAAAFTTFQMANGVFKRSNRWQNACVVRGLAVSRCGCTGRATTACAPLGFACRGREMSLEPRGDKQLTFRWPPASRTFTVTMTEPVDASADATVSVHLTLMHRTRCSETLPL